MIKRQVHAEIRKADMPEDMQQDAVNFAVDVRDHPIFPTDFKILTM